MCFLVPFESRVYGTIRVVRVRLNIFNRGSKPHLFPSIEVQKQFIVEDQPFEIHIRSCVRETYLVIDIWFDYHYCVISEISI